MKKYIALFVAVAFALSAVVAMAAEEKKAAPAPAPAAAPAAPAKDAPKAEKKMEKKAKAQFVTGTIEAIDAAAGTLTVKGKKASVELKAGEKVKLDGFAKGDKVTVKYADGKALSVKKVTKKEKAAGDAPKKDDAKKADAPKKDAAPAPAPAPAAPKK